MHTRNYYFINALTFYRFTMAPVLIMLAINGQSVAFRWLLAVSFFTDAIDGALSRHFHVTSIFGSRLDSIGDDLTVLAAVAGMIIFRPDFVKQEYPVMIALATLFLVQLVLAFIRYRKMTSFHTYIAKMAAVMQGVFFILLFFCEKTPYVFFRLTIILTALDLIEEIILVLMLKRWRANIKGIYWVIRGRQI
ncbi:MAG: CDP-alcohol phosphatidyltransferase family protein [Citrobacter freundii]|nr:MAG: CDP-alcohol phosphatidyltransferase family protein [Citrobacter freundii]